MARATIDGLEIAYELIGDAGAHVVAITPGGRFPMDSPGVPELGRALVAGGKRVLLWDRPNCGASDVCFDGSLSESEIQARALIGLARHLELGPIALAAGSGGSRVSLLAAVLDPNAVSHLCLWWISGGPLGLMQLAAYYCGESATLASFGSMAPVADSPAWKLQIERNPRNRELILQQDPKQFVEAMQNWAMAYAPSAKTPIPSISPEQFATLTMPVLILRNGESDLSHTRATSDWVYKMIPHAKMIDPPWPDDEWNRCMQGQARGEGLFIGWPKAAPAILAFTAR